MFGKTIAATDKYKEAAQNEAEYIEGAGDKIDSIAQPIEINDFKLKVARTATTITITGEVDTDELDKIEGFQFLLKENSMARSVGVWTNTQEELTYVYTQERDGIENDKEYIASMRIIDKYGNAHNATNNNEIVVSCILASELLTIGDYVDYDAGEWTTDDINLIKKTSGVHSTVTDNVTGNQTRPTATNQFGGFELGDSRNGNATPFIYTKDGVNYGTARTSGWRVWDKDETTGVVTLISAGNPESFYHYQNSTTSVPKLVGRDYSMYVDTNYATSAKVLTGQEAVRWYNKQFGTSYAVVENGQGSSTTFYNKPFDTDEKIEVLENGTWFWVASKYSEWSMYCISSYSRVLAR